MIIIKNKNDNNDNHNNHNNNNNHKHKSKIKKYCLMIKVCISIAKNVINIQVIHFQKKLILISKNKIKDKSRCAICLTERPFIHEIEYDLESELEIYLQFFTD